MSNVLRAAVAATSLFSFPACATTGSFDKSFAEAIETATGTGRFESTQPAGAPASAAPAPGTPAGAPSAGAPAGGGQAFGSFAGALGGAAADAPETTLSPGGGGSGGAAHFDPDTPEATVAAGGVAQWSRDVLAPASAELGPPPQSWEPTRAVLNSGAGGFANLMFEPTDSRLRIVLNMADSVRGAGGEASDAVAPAAEWLGNAAFWQTGPTAGAAEVLGLGVPRVELAMPSLGDSGVLAGWPVDSRHTPEPGTLALTALGLCGVGMARRLRRA